MIFLKLVMSPLLVYNLLGNQVKTLVSGYQEPGYKTILWNATNERGAPVSAGMYLYSIKQVIFIKLKNVAIEVIEDT